MSAILLTGENLISRLQSTTQLVKWLPVSLPPRKIEPALAIAHVRSGIYIGKATSTRVIYIREVDPRQHCPADFHYRDDRAVIQACTVTAATVAYWSQCLQSKEEADAAKLAATPPHA